MNIAIVALTKRQAMDVAALANAAGTMEDPQSLRGIHVKFTEDYVQFGATNGMVVAVRRGTLGEFGGQVRGEGIFSYPAKQLARILRIAIQDKTRITTSLAFGDGYLEVNGENVGTVEFHDLKPDRIGSLVDDYFEHRYHESESTLIGLPTFSMKLLTKLASSAGPHKTTMASFRQDVNRNSRWYFITTPKDSWRFCGAMMEIRT